MVFLLAQVTCLSLAACGVGSSEGENEDYYIPGVIEDTDYDFTDDNPAEQLGYDSIDCFLAKCPYSCRRRAHEHIRTIFLYPSLFIEKKEIFKIN